LGLPFRPNNFTVIIIFDSNKEQEMKVAPGAVYEVVEFGVGVVTSTVGGQSLDDMGVVFNPRAKTISIINTSSEPIYINRGVASAASYPMVATEGVNIRLSVKAASELRIFIAAGPGSIKFMQEGAR
jgi:hypothetical protein